MARKQSDYLADILSAHPGETGTAPFPAAPERMRATTLLGRESALARIQSGEVRQVTQLLLDPARVRVWAGNVRLYTLLSEENCRELINSIVAEGGQKVLRSLAGSAAIPIMIMKSLPARVGIGPSAGYAAIPTRKYSFWPRSPSWMMRPLSGSRTWKIARARMSRTWSARAIMRRL